MKISSNFRLVRNLIISGLTTLGIVEALHVLNLGEWYSGWFLLLGLFYGIFFEYVYHRWVLHAATGFLPSRHRLHHREYAGENFRTTDQWRGHISEHWIFFPVALVSHIGVMLPLGIIPMWFVVGLWVFYGQFEIFHWATHIQDNWLDKVLLRVPVVKRMREMMIIHHYIHHDRPRTNYNFTEPYLGDIVFGTQQGIE